MAAGPPSSRASLPSRNGTIYGDPTYADAILDRIVHSRAAFR